MASSSRRCDIYIGGLEIQGEKKLDLFIDKAEKTVKCPCNLTGS